MNTDTIRRAYNSLENKDDSTKEDVLRLAQSALKVYSRRSNLAKRVDKTMWDVVLAGGCKNKLMKDVGALIENI